MDGRAEERLVAASDGGEAPDGVLGETHDVVDDRVRHQCEDRLDVRVVLGPELGIDQAVEHAPFVVAGLQGVHASYRERGR
jgi:hypothetical protein